MGRQKLLLLVAGAGVLGYWFYLGSAAVHDGLSASTEAASALGGRAADAVNIHVLSRKAELAEELLRLTQSPPFAAAVQEPQLGGSAETVSVQRFNALRTAVFATVPESGRAAWVLGLTDASGDALFAKGDGEPAARLPGFSSEGLRQLGTEGTFQPVGSEPYVFFALPLAATDKSPRLILGTPALEKDALAPIAQSLKLASLEMVGADDVSMGSAGPALQPLRAEARKGGALQVLDSRLQPVVEPLRTRWLRGARTPRWVCLRSPLGGTGLTVVSVADVGPSLARVARSEERWALGVLLGLLLAVVSLILPLRKGAVPKVEVEELDGEALDGEALDGEELDGEELDGEEPEGAVILTGELEQELPQASRHEAPIAAPDDVFANFGLPPREAAVEPPVDGATSSRQENPATVSGGAEAYSSLSSEHLDATRVMAMSEVLLAASALRSERAEDSLLPAPLMGEPLLRSTPSPEVFDQEQHYRAVFLEFLSAREECGETSEGLTFDKFSTKLRKNREQLTERMNCQNVRFQVYVKEGKAALKASPVR